MMIAGVESRSTKASLQDRTVISTQQSLNNVCGIPAFAAAHLGKRCHLKAEEELMYCPSSVLDLEFLTLLPPAKAHREHQISWIACPSARRQLTETTISPRMMTLIFSLTIPSTLAHLRVHRMTRSIKSLGPQVERLFCTTPTPRF